MTTQPTDKEEPKNKKKSKLVIIVASLSVLLAVAIYYSSLLKIKMQLPVNESTQEQFAGTVQVSEQLQSECQKSAEKIISLSVIGAEGVATKLVAMFAEYRQNAENCREVYFSTENKTEKKTQENILFRSEGTYPDLIVDIAMLAAKTNKTQAIEMLNFAKNLAAWEFYMGPIVCNSKTTIEAYLESLNLPAETACFKAATDKEKLFTEIKNKNFLALSASLSSNHVVSLGLINSEVGCPEKISLIVQLVQKASAGNLKLEEEIRQNSSTDGINFVFKTDTENKLILEFAAVEDCLQLQSVLVPEQQVNE